MTYLKIDNVFFSIKTKEILNGVNLEVEKHSIFGLLGQNGSGKSTLIKVILGILPPTRGKIFINDQIFNAATRIDHLKRIGSLIEQASLYSHLTCFENLELARRIYGTERKLTCEMIELVGLTDVSDDKVETFSVGMKQRLGIALAMIGQPELLILDEPTSGLDPGGVLALRNLVAHLNSKMGTTFLVSSHDLSEIEKIATHIGILNGGKIVFQERASNLTGANLEAYYFKAIG